MREGGIGSEKNKESKERGREIVEKRNMKSLR
jgi:hypothetical protein